MTTWRVDLEGNVPEAAARGGAALREESQQAATLAAALKEAQRETAALKAAQSALAGGGQAVDVEAYRALSGEIDRAAGKAAGLATELAKTGQAGRDFDGEARSAKALAKETEDAAKAQQKEATAARRAAEEQHASSRKTIQETREQVAGVGALAARVGAYGAALAGLHGLGDLASMAIGWRTLGQLQMVSWKATMDLRQAVRGVDAQPLVRAATALERNLSKSSVTGNALSGILTRGFDGFFHAVERLEPVVEFVFQGMVLGALETEVAFQKARGTLAPLIVTLEEAAGETDLISAASSAAAVGFQGLTVYVETAAKAIDFAYQSAVKLNDALGGIPLAVLQRVPDAAKALNSVYSGAGRALTAPLAQGADALQAFRNRDVDPGESAAGGEATGKATGEGVVKGIDSMIAAVFAAGRKLGEAGVTGARAGADAHSPSRATYKLGDDMAEGDIQGMRARAGDVERTAAEVLAPKVTPGPSSTSAAPTAGAPININLAVAFHGIDGGKRADLERGADLLVSALRSGLIRAGVPLPGVTR